MVGRGGFERERREKGEKKREKWSDGAMRASESGRGVRRQTNLFKNVTSNVGKRDGGVDITDIYKSSEMIHIKRRLR